MIFVTGASRSGTTLLSFVLRNHSQVFGLKELHYFGEVWDPRQGEVTLSPDKATAAAALILARQAGGVFAGREGAQQHSQAAGLIDGREASPAEVFAATTAALAREAGKTIPCEQTPRNIFYAAALLDTFPNARVVHILRDPRGVMASQKKRWRRRGLAADRNTLSRYQSLRVWVNYHPYTIARMWLRATRAAEALAEHPRFLLVRFEDLLRNPEDTVRTICSHVGIEYEAPMLDVGQVNSSHQSSVGGARPGLQPAAIDTWRGSLSAGEAAVTERICGAVMLRYGYEPEQTAGRSELRFRLTYLLHLVGVALVNPGRAWIQVRAMLGFGQAKQS